jgi:hypothetical protein
MDEDYATIFEVIVTLKNLALGVLAVIHVYNVEVDRIIGCILVDTDDLKDLITIVGG